MLYLKREINYDVIMVNSIIKIMEVNGTKYFYTKGDNNDSADGCPTKTSDIVGKAKLNVPYLGYQPSR